MRKKQMVVFVLLTVSVLRADALGFHLYARTNCQMVAHVSLMLIVSRADALGFHLWLNAGPSRARARHVPLMLIVFRAVAQESFVPSEEHAIELAG